MSREARIRFLTPEESVITVQRRGESGVIDRFVQHRPGAIGNTADELGGSFAGDDDGANRQGLFLLHRTS